MFDLEHTTFKVTGNSYEPSTVPVSDDKKWSGTERCVDKYGAVELVHRGRYGDRLHLREAAKRVTFRHQFGNRSIVQRSGQQQDDIVNHITVTARSSKHFLHTVRYYKRM